MLAACQSELSKDLKHVISVTRHLDRSSPCACETNLHRRQFIVVEIYHIQIINEDHQEQC